MDNIERQREHFEKISEIYYNSRQNSNHLLLKDYIWNYFFSSKDYLKKDNATVLEPMCGYSEGKKILEEKLGINICYEGFDYSQPLIDKVKKSDPSIYIYKMDVTKFNKKDQYDIIILIGGIHHVPDNAKKVMKNLSMSLKRGGYFINFEPTQNNAISTGIRNIIYKRNKLFDNQTEKGFELQELNDIYSSSGLTVVDQIYPGLLSYILYYNPDAFPKLNLGNSTLVGLLFNIDKLFFRNFIGKKFSFATLTLLQKV